MAIRRALAVLLLAPPCALAVSPLTVDDADTTPRLCFQINAVPQIHESGADRLYLVPVNPVYGLTDRGEIGATIGYLRIEPRDRPASAGTGGSSDLVLSTKWQLWSEDSGLKLGVRIDGSVPVASESGGLGTGKADVGGTLIVTRCWDKTCLDGNVGYLAVDVARSVFGDDAWFFGQALRQDFGGAWTLMAEVWALVANGSEAAPTNVHFDGGLQWAVRDNLFVAGILGTAVGRGSPDFIGRLGLTWVF